MCTNEPLHLFECLRIKEPDAKIDGQMRHEHTWFANLFNPGIKCTHTFANHRLSIALCRHFQHLLFCSQLFIRALIKCSFSTFVLFPHCRSINYHGESNFSALLTPITFLISYFNSAFNPLLYAFLSRNFRKGMREIIFCSFKKKNSKEQQRIPLHVSKSVFWQIFIERCRLIALKMNTHS